MCMTMQTFSFGERDSCGTESPQAVRLIFLHGDDLEEVGDAEASAHASEAAGGECVVGAGDVVAERLRRIWADEDGAGVADPCEVGFAVDGEVFGGESVGDLVCFVGGASHDCGAVATDGFASGGIGSRPALYLVDNSAS